MKNGRGGRSGYGRRGRGNYFLEFVLLGDFVFACFSGLSVQLLCCELEELMSVTEPLSIAQAKYLPYAIP